MITQKLSISSPQDLNNLQSAKLIAEIGSNHIALTVKTQMGIGAFELYDIDIQKTNWQSVFAGLKNYSKILSHSYNQNVLHIALNESLIIPQSKFANDAIEPYLTTVYGGGLNHLSFAETINIPTTPQNIYRIPTALYEVIKSSFNSFVLKHSYTKILENLLGMETMVMEMIKVQFYGSQMIVAVVANNKLQIIQTYNYSSAEDVVYYLLNIVQEFGLNVKSTPVEVSGFIDMKSKHYELLANLFGRLSFETINAQGIFKEILNVSNAHFYTPFYNLGL